jgi:hypothetical protein
MQRLKAVFRAAAEFACCSLLSSAGFAIVSCYAAICGTGAAQDAMMSGYLRRLLEKAS